MTWDCFNRLRSLSRQLLAVGNSETTWYVYDLDGNRVRIVTERASQRGAASRKLNEQ